MGKIMRKNAIIIDDYQVLNFVRFVLKIMQKLVVFFAQRNNQKWKLLNFVKGNGDVFHKTIKLN